MKHVHTQPAKENFAKLQDRILATNTAENVNNMREMIYNLAASKKSTLIMATGGSKVVAYYLQMLLERIGADGIFCEVIEPRDYFHKENVSRFHNLVVVSASGKSNGIQEALKSFPGQKFLICENSEATDFNVINWGYELNEKEKSFISLSTSLCPITLMLGVANSSSEKRMIDNEITLLNERIKELLFQSQKQINMLQANFKDISLIHILTGYDTRCASNVLESNLTESGAIPCVIHDKGSFCHGRSNLLFRNKYSHVVYLSHEKTPLDETLLEVLKNRTPHISVCEANETVGNFFWQEYYLLLQMYYLSKKMAEEKHIDLTQPSYDSCMVTKLYSFRGRM